MLLVLNHFVALVIVMSLLFPLIFCFLVFGALETVLVQKVLKS
jgi:hypothetical protein